MKPVLLVVAGPNGAGKTTVTVRLREEHWSEHTEYINPDDVARDRFGDWNSAHAVAQAATWSTNRRTELLNAGLGIAFETVFSTDEKVEFLRRAKAAGYFIRLFFISTRDPRINASRVAGRMLQGGHAVPIDKIIARYERSIANLRQGIALADRAYIYDNSEEDQEARLCARTTDGMVRKIYGPLPVWVADAIAALQDHPSFTDLRHSRS
jgi:predicted ABC-type ATPase